ncbi:hypothetical protein Htur_3682 [Haloterrigena turkmenica DSM 5511]|uniref:DUF7260 domain-containing protein n=1 Tax=Haloterrigena turkmenica (strain ATCC 51198 / DSM 5511 / JCM 9101 / NCIMB 13204 / VKM B-1734 / 4k) TaxID=543526 RepID=D2RRS7_HALTV|nr:hypothetical protein [Haloterrigena turkmenica]ADB62544.1 hypothetical protein Htur_3682 [Haloterrigena turkmenica DSM 5511]
MTDSTVVHRAVACLEDERADVADRASALETFARQVRDVPTASGPAQAAVAVPATPKAMATAVGSAAATPKPPDDRCATVREAFVDTVEPHTIAADDDSLGKTMAAELSEEIAVSLAAEADWTPALKRAVLEEIETQRRKTVLLEETLQRERRTLEEAIDEIDEIVAWLRTTADESLLQCGFDDLHEKHGCLEAHRDRLETLIDDRQRQFSGETNPRGTADYRGLVAAIYADLSVQYPLLSTATRLYGICGDCQRTVRAHLARRV